MSWARRIRVKNETGKVHLSLFFVQKRDKEGTKKIVRLLTVSIVEDDDASLLRLSLLRVHHGGADDKIH